MAGFFAKSYTINMKQPFLLKIKKNSAFFYEQEDMSNHCSFRTGGKATYYCEPKNKKSFAEIVKLCNQNNLPYYIMGNGTNLLFFGFDGLVICLKQLRSIEVDGTTLICEAGVPLMRLGIFASECGLSGLEWSYGIPGTVGGAVIMNAGAYGHEIGEFIEKVEIFDGRRFKTLKKDKNWFSYRESYFKKNNLPVTKVYINLTKVEDNQPIKQKMMEHFELRRKNHPLEWPSAGSMFRRTQDVIPSKLIDELGLKGLTVGGAQVSEKHAGFVINKGGATPQDIEQLTQQIKQIVHQKSGVELEREVIFVKQP